jgi:hypothetical protein
VTVIGAEVTTSYSADGAPLRTPLMAGTIVEGAVTSASVRVFFSRFLLPAKVIRQSVCLHPTTETVSTIADCREPFQPFELPAYSPVDRAVTFRLPEGARLAADTQYRLTVFATDSLDETGIFAFDGAPLDRDFTFEFRTQPDDSTAQDEVSPSAQSYCAQVGCFETCSSERATCGDACVEALTTCNAACAMDEACMDLCGDVFEACDQPCIDAETVCANQCACFEPSCTVRGNLLDAGLFTGSCAFGQCHGTSGGGEDIAMGLDLTNAATIEATALGKTAFQTQMGEDAVVGDQNPLRFGRAMPLIDPGNPGNSYLMYKVLANDLTFLLTPDLEDAASLDPALLEEIDRLRASVVVGLPMPAQSAGGPPDGINFATPEVSRFESARLLEQWIAGGAVTDCDAL